MINVNHEEIETIIQALEEEMGAIQARIDELYQLQWQNRIQNQTPQRLPFNRSRGE